MRSRGPHLIVLLLCSALGCGPGGVSVSTSAGEVSSGTSGDGDGDSGDGDGDPGDGDGDPGDGDGGPPLLPCDPAAPSCPEASKCVPYSSTDSVGSIDGYVCVEVLGDRVPGQPCSFDGWASPTDDCDGASFCLSGSEGSSSCQPLCSTNEDCTPGEACLLGLNGIPTCVLNCDPLIQDCQPEQACYLVGTYSPGTFMWDYACMPIEAAHGQGEVCGADHQCAQGYGCVPALYHPTCDGGRCCTSFCDLYNPICPDLPDVQCIDIEQGNGWASVGLCVVP